MESKLIINKGEYIISKELGGESVSAKLIVYYQQQKFRWQWLSPCPNNSVKKEIINYLKSFALEMIASKSNRNFYK